MAGTAFDGNRVPAELLRWNCVSVVARGVSQSLTHRSGAETLKSWRTVVWTGAFIGCEVKNILDIVKTSSDVVVIEW